MRKIVICEDSEIDREILKSALTQYFEEINEKIEEIMYIESSAHTVKIHLKDGTDISSVEKLGDIEKRINEKRFLRCNQSYLVNMDFIRDANNSSFIMQDGAELPIRVRGKKDMLDACNFYFVNNYER